MPTLIEQREALQAAVDSATVRLSQAQQRARGTRADVGEELTKPLRDFDAAHPFDPPMDRRRQLTDDLLLAVRERGLLAAAARTPAGWGLTLIDPAIDSDLEEAVAGQTEARRKLAEFNAKNADAIAEECKAEAVAAVKAALKTGDPDLIREAVFRQEEADQTAVEQTHEALISGAYEGWEDDTSRTAPLGVGEPDRMTTADLD